MPKSKSAKTRFRALPVIRAACPLFRRSYYTRLARHDFLPVFHSDLSARWTVMSRQINRLSNFKQQRLVARRRIALAPSRIKLRITTVDKSRHAQVWAPKVPLPGGIRALPEHASSGPHESHPERHLDRFSRFSTARGCDQQTHRQTERPRNVDRPSNRPHLCISCTRYGHRRNHN